MRCVKGFVLVFALVLIVAYLWMPTYSLAPDTGTCPHENFLAKHVCRHCTTEKEALEFSREARVGHWATGRNSVIIGNPQFVHSGESCHNDPGVTVLECNLNSGYCYFRGRDCKTRHHTENGHLFYRETACQ